MQLVLTDNTFDPKPYWENPIHKYDSPFHNCVDLFDTNGYDLTELEQDYAEVNTPAALHRYTKALKYDWFKCSEVVIEGVHINHALLFERKAYAGKALEQLKNWCDRLPLVHKLTKIQSKWGIDLSIDYVDKNGNAFEVFHYEWDDFDYDKVMRMKDKIEHLALNTDWDKAAADLLEKRGDWMHLPFFEQSDWKCDYFGIEPEKFKENIWNDMP
jgi:hypothetical protein